MAFSFVPGFQVEAASWVFDRSQANICDDLYDNSTTAIFDVMTENWLSNMKHNIWGI